MPKALLPPKTQHSQIRIVHISDIHFFVMKWRLKGLFKNKAAPFFSQVNYILNRNRKFTQSEVDEVVSTINSISPDIVIISGDLTTKGTEEEFDLVNSILISKIDSNFIIVPGNHDTYCQDHENQNFISFINNNNKILTSRKLTEEKIEEIEIGPIENRWSLISLDQTLNPSIERIAGKFEIDKKLKSISENSNNKKIIIGHFPLNEPKIFLGGLIGANNLVDFISKSNDIHAYLHGHYHCFSLSRISKNCISVDCGSCLIGKNTKSFAVFDLFSDGIVVHQISKAYNWKLQSSFTLNK